MLGLNPRADNQKLNNAFNPRGLDGPSNKAVQNTLTIMK